MYTQSQASQRSLAGRSVVVTGGAGFVGSHLLERLVRERPARLAALDNLCVGKPEHLDLVKSTFPDVALHILDTTSIGAVRRVLRAERADVVFDLATLPLRASLVKPRWAADRITRMVTVLAELARLGEYGTLIHTSSSEAYGTAQTVPMAEDHPLLPETPYAAAKAAGDLILRSYWETFGIDATIVRPFNTYGPRQQDGPYAALVTTVIRRLQAGLPPVIQGDGEQTRDFLFVEDTADAIARTFGAVGARHSVINIASGQETSINDLVSRLSRLMGYDGPPQYVPTRAADVRRHLADTTRARRLVGFTPRVSLEEGLRRTVAWYQAHPLQATQ